MIVRDGKAEKELIESAKKEVAGLVENEAIKGYLVDTEDKVTYNDEENSATVHLKKAVTKDDLGNISGTGIMKSIENVFCRNKLSQVTISIGNAEVTIDSVGNLDKIKGSIVEKLQEGISDTTVVKLVAKGDNLGEEGVTYTVNFAIKSDQSTGE